MNVEKTSTDHKFPVGLHHGFHYILVLKFKDFSRAFKDPEVAFSRTNSRRKFTAGQY